MSSNREEDIRAGSTSQIFLKNTGEYKGGFYHRVLFSNCDPILVDPFMVSVLEKTPVEFIFTPSKHLKELGNRIKKTIERFQNNLPNRLESLMITDSQSFLGGSDFVKELNHLNPLTIEQKKLVKHFFEMLDPIKLDSGFRSKTEYIDSRNKVGKILDGLRLPANFDMNSRENAETFFYEWAQPLSSDIRASKIPLNDWIGLLEAIDDGNEKTKFLRFIQPFDKQLESPDFCPMEIAPVEATPDVREKIEACKVLLSKFCSEFKNTKSTNYKLMDMFLDRHNLLEKHPSRSQMSAVFNIIFAIKKFQIDNGDALQTFTEDLRQCHSGLESILTDDPFGPHKLKLAIKFFEIFHKENQNSIDALRSFSLDFYWSVKRLDRALYVGLEASMSDVFAYADTFFLFTPKALDYLQEAKDIVGNMNIQGLDQILTNSRYLFDHLKIYSESFCNDSSKYSARHTIPRDKYVTIRLKISGMQFLKSSLENFKSGTSQFVRKFSEFESKYLKLSKYHPTQVLLKWLSQNNIKYNDNLKDAAITMDFINSPFLWCDQYHELDHYLKYYICHILSARDRAVISGTNSVLLFDPLHTALSSNGQRLIAPISQYLHSTQYKKDQDIYFEVLNENEEALGRFSQLLK